MAGYKRRRDELDDSDDEEPSFGKQILPVADLPDDFDAPPADGMQYLFTVRRDARCLPHVTSVPNPYELTSMQTSQPDSRVIPSHIILPSNEWRTLVEIRFKNFRKNVNQPTIGVPLIVSDERQRLMPDKKERDLWWAYLAGKSESDWNPPKQSKKASLTRRPAQLDDVTEEQESLRQRRGKESWQTNDEGEVELVLRVDPTESLPTPTGSPTPTDFGQAGPSSGPSSGTLAPPATVTWRPREPLPSILRHIDQPMALHLLMYFTHWINLHVQKQDPKYRPVESHAHWIFALLSKVGDELSGDDMSLLRNLARACVALLKGLFAAQIKVEDTEKVSQSEEGILMSTRSCWMIISTITGVWAQRDLWLDAEEALKTHEPTEGFL